MWSAYSYSRINSFQRQEKRSLSHSLQRKGDHLNLQAYNYYVKEGKPCFVIKTGDTFYRRNFRQNVMPETLFKPKHVNIDPEDTLTPELSTINQQIICKGYYAFSFIDFASREHKTNKWHIVLVHRQDVYATFIDIEPED